MISADSLIEKFQYALDNHWGYIMYMTHEMWSEAKQADYNKRYADDPDCEMSRKYGSKWYGDWVTDCSGLFKWAFTELGGKIAHGSNSIWDKYCSSKGELVNGRRTDGKVLQPGTAVFTSSGNRHNHIGLYIGDGIVIEAQGTQTGVVTSKITNKKWTHWGELSAVLYGKDDPDGKETRMEAKVVLPSGATGTTVNMRERPDKKSGIVTRVPVGADVIVTKDSGDWCAIEYNGLSGWMMSNYLEYAGQGGESTDGQTLTPADQDAIDKALKAIEDAVEVIGSIVGRG